MEYSSRPSPRASGIKRTYASRRTILTNINGDDSNYEPNTIVPHMSQLPSPFRNPSRQDEQIIVRPTFQSVHELRRAGANNRFSAHVDDIFQRISASGPIRQVAIMELASGVVRDEFARRFHDNGLKISFLDQIESERDRLSSFGILAIIITLLSGESFTRVACQLCDYDITQFLLWTLSSDEIITEFDKHGDITESYDVRKFISTVQTYLIHLNVFDMPEAALNSPPTITLQIMALAMINLMADRSPDRDFIIIGLSLMDILFNILDSSRKAAVSTKFVLSIIENWCIKGVKAGQHPSWKREHVRISTNLLHIAMECDIHDFSDAHTMILKLALNITKGNPQVCINFVESGCTQGRILSSLMRGIRDRIVLVQSQWFGTMVDKTIKDIILMINLLINLIDDSVVNRNLLYLSHKNGDSSLLDMMRIFINCPIEEVNFDNSPQCILSPAFGFMSVLIGYLMLDTQIRHVFLGVHNRGPLLALDDLISYISEFRTSTNNDGPDAYISARLYNLIKKLEIF